VAVPLQGSISIADMPPWNPIKGVSSCAPPGLHLNCWHAFMKSYPACEWLCPSWAPLQSLTCCYHILSSLYLSSHLLPLPHSINSILQVESVQGLVKAQFNVRSYPILFSSLHSYISNYIGTFFVFFHWWLILHFHLYLQLFHTICSHSCLSWTFFLDCPARLQSGFTKAWIIYLKTQHALVDQKLDDYLRSKGSNDWFTMKHCPSEEECAECRKIVLNNLLCKFSLCFLWAGIADIFLAHPKTLPWWLCWHMSRTSQSFWTW